MGASLLPDSPDSDMGQRGRSLLSEEDAGLVMGVGAGVFAIGFLLFFCIILCLLGSRSSKTSAAYTGSTLLFVLVVVILVASPRGEVSHKRPPEGYDQTLIPLVIVLVLMCIGVLASLGTLLKFQVQQQFFARPLNYYSDVLKQM